jgi:cytoskeleton protein RodZ
METTVGQQLKKARETLGLRIEDAAQGTHIKLTYLQELENDHPELLPSPANARGFLRLYASFLKISSQPLIDLWDHPILPEPTHAPDQAMPVTGTNQPLQTEAPEPVLDSLFAEEVSEDEGDGKKQENVSPAEILSEPLPLEDEIKPVKKKRGRKKKVNLIIQGGVFTEPEQESVQTPDPILESPSEVVVEEPIQNLDQEISAELPQIPEKSSVELFNEIGTVLRQRRETLQLSLADIERFTHIKRPYLEALEGGNFSQLPSSVQGRGMLNNYVAFLSMDEETVLGLYAAALEAQRQERLPPRKREPIVTGGIRFNIPEPFKKYMNPDLLFGSVIILAIFIFLLWGAVQVFTQQNNKTTPTGPSISEVLQATPSILITPDLTLTAQATPNPAGTAVPGAGLPATPAGVTPIATKNSAPLQLNVVALQRAYLKVTLDGVVKFDGRVQPGSVYTYSGQKSIELLTGSAAAVEVYFNQKFMGKLGEVGQVIKLSFNEKGLTTPVATLTPQITATSIPSKTPQITPTPK